MKNIFFLIILIILSSCNSASPEYERYNESMGKKINLSMFPSALGMNGEELLDSIRYKYDYFSLVYLQNHCQTCYEKYIEWNKEMDILNTDNYTVIFIIKGMYDDEFISEVNSIENIEHKYYLIMDPNELFIKRNFSIPKWIIENSLLIDKENRIRLIGPPFYNEKMIKKYLDVVQE